MYRGKCLDAQRPKLELWPRSTSGRAVLKGMARRVSVACGETGEWRGEGGGRLGG